MNGSPQAEALRNLLSAFMQNSTFLAQVSADVSALKTVVSALGPEAKKALEEQIAIERDKTQQHVADIQMLLESLRSSFPKMQS
jgi:hypothetical protein